MHSITLPQVTLCAIDCVQVASTIKALTKSKGSIQFASCKLFTNDPVPLLKCGAHTGIQAVEIEELKCKEAYSRYVFKWLSGEIDTPFMIIVQYDGYILNPGAWDNTWLGYDYIGAPWWYDDGYNVGNGGFSLRSKRLMDYLRHSRFRDLHPEDDRICREYRPHLEGVGFRFATEEVAEAFSWEPNPKHPNPRPGVFGFHGVPDLIL